MAKKLLTENQLEEFKVWANKIELPANENSYYDYFMKIKGIVRIK